MKAEIFSQGSIAVIFKSFSCSCMNITLPNLNIHLSQKDFYSFAWMIEEISRCHTNNKMILVSTPYEGIDLHFKLKELIELRRVLRAAVVKLRVRELKIGAEFCLN